MLVKPTPDLDSQQQIALHLEIQQALMERLRETLLSDGSNDVNLPLVDQSLLSIDQQQEVVTTGVLGHFPKDEYEQFFADVWVGVVLTLMVLSCVCCMCSCLLYHKFQQWKRSVLENRTQRNDVEIGGDVESLPSYTIVSGLPSYDEALEQLRQIKASKPAVKDAVVTNDKAVEASVTGALTPISIISNSDMASWQPHTPPTPNHMPRLSVVDLFQIYRNTNVPMTSSLAAVINDNKT